MSRKILVVGANRGIGLELVRQSLEAGEQVWAVCRNPTEASSLLSLKEAHPGSLSVLKGDVSSDDDRHACLTQLSQEAQTLDVMVHNAGVYLEGIKRQDFPQSIQAENILETFKVNSLAPLLWARDVSPLIEKGRGKTLAVVTSKMGSLADNTSGGAYSYRISKAAVNMAYKSLSVDLESKGIHTLMLHPGWVQTDMGGASAPTTPSESAEGLWRVLNSAKELKNGGFYDFRGEEVPY